jgi:hypothetical protein
VSVCTLTIVFTRALAARRNHWIVGAVPPSGREVAMYGFVFYLIVLAVLRWVRRKRVPNPRGLCARCTFAHIQHGMNARTATFCTFAGMVRPIKLDVLYCTDFRDRDTPRRVPVIGFARPMESAEPVAQYVAVER